MSPDLLVDFVLGLVSAATAVSVALIGSSKVQQKRSREQELRDAKRDQWLEDKLSAIEKKLDEHNHYAKRFEEIEKATVGIHKDIEYLKSR